MKNKQKEWHYATKPLKILALKNHISGGNCNTAAIWIVAGGAQEQRGSARHSTRTGPPLVSAQDSAGTVQSGLRSL